MSKSSHGSRCSTSDDRPGPRGWNVTSVFGAVSFSPSANARVIARSSGVSTFLSPPSTKITGFAP